MMTCSDSSQLSSHFIVARQGFEPQFSHPECDVLPLDDRAIIQTICVLPASTRCRLSTRGGPLDDRAIWNRIKGFIDFVDFTA